MTKESKGKCEAASRKLLKEKAKTRVQELRGMFTNIQIAKKEGRTADMAIFEDQMDQMLGGWIAELNDPSPASSLHGGSHGRLESFSDDLARFSKQQCDEKDDAESPLKDLPQPNLEGPEPGVFFFSSKGPPEDIEDFEFPDVVPDVLPDICPPASAFQGPKCVLWECSRPVHGLCWDYCGRDHAHLARNEGLPGKTPVLRPWGIALKDGSLFAALNDKTQGKDVGIPDCDEAATLRSPWDDSELFDLSLLEGETSREWLFFGRPRKAFQSGNRKRRSLRNYRGRWHVSRTQEMKEYGGQKRSYYMDPQPSSDREWHLFEYEVNNSDACALYRRELKFGTAKKSSKGKQSNGTTSKNAEAGNIFGSDNQTTPCT